MPAIQTDSLQIGNPLPWNVFNHRGALLLRKGYSVTSHQQISRLIHQGYLIDEKRWTPLSLLIDNRNKYLT
jgi:hypothetical protein